MSGFNLSKAIESIAPTLAAMIGTAIGGPIGPLAGTAVSALMSAFGMQPSGDTQKDITNVSDAIQAGKMTPQIVAQIRAADQKHAEVIAQQGIDLQKLNSDHEQAMANIAAQDRDSARKRQMIIKDRTPAHLAYMVTIGFYAVAAALLYAFFKYSTVMKGLDPQAWTLIGLIVGMLGNEAKGASAYYFGTTQGSDKKTDLLSRAQPIRDDSGAGKTQ